MDKARRKTLTRRQHLAKARAARGKGKKVLAGHIAGRPFFFFAQGSAVPTDMLHPTGGTHVHIYTCTHATYVHLQLPYVGIDSKCR